MDLESCEKFYNLGRIVTERNHLSLNDCLLLFNSLVCPDINVNRKTKWVNFKYHELTLNVSVKMLIDVAQWLNVMWEKGHAIHKQAQQDDEFIFREEDAW